MNGREIRAAIDGVIDLAGCAARGSVPDLRRLEGVDRELLCDAARRHMLGAAVGMALESAGLRDERFARAIAQSQRRMALLDADRSAVLERLEEAGIWHMPLKGVVLKELYPRFGMREMADNDILFDADRAEDVRRIMNDLGFSTEGYGRGAHDVYCKPPVSRFEMHRALFSETRSPDLYPYYARVKGRLIPDGDSAFGFHFSDEDFYLYLVAHEYKHYSRGGTGLRSLLDIYVFLRHRAPDMAYVEREAEKIGIAAFERASRELALHLFDASPLSDGEREMLEYIAFSGAYGSMEQYIDNQIARKGRWGYFLSRLNMPRNQMEELFPFLKRAPFLYPLCWVLRLLRGFFLRNRYFRIQLKAALGWKRRRDGER